MGRFKLHIPYVCTACGTTLQAIEGHKIKERAWCPKCEVGVSDDDVQKG